MSSRYKAKGVLPSCARSDCFACRNGRCAALTKCLEPNCPFFKTRGRIGIEARRAMARLAAQGHDVKMEFPVLYHIATTRHD